MLKANLISSIGVPLLVPGCVFYAFPPMASLSLSLYVPQKEELEGAINRHHMRDSHRKDHLRLPPSIAWGVRNGSPKMPERAFGGREQKLVSSDGVGVYSTGLSPPTGPCDGQSFGPNHETE